MFFGLRGPGAASRRSRQLPVVFVLSLLQMSLAAAAPAVAQEFFASRRGFVVDKPCVAYGSFKRKSSPVPLVVGKSYPARGANARAAPSHAFLALGPLGNKWVDLGCGHFADGSAAFPSEGGAAAVPRADGGRADHSGQCLPFFDGVDNPVKVKVGGKVDISPPPPSLDGFDKAIVAACGAPGTVVEPAAFKALLAAHPDVLERIRAFTGGRVFADRPPRTDKGAFVDDLTEAWFAVKAFDHIMCGEPGAGRGKIGGMHFHARYLELQEKGLACLMGNYGQNEVVPGVLYTTGVVMRMSDGREVRDARKGYGLTLSGEDLLKLVTRAFAENPTSKSESTACLLPVADDGRSFTAVFVRRSAGIRTFYPDATPSPREPKCRAPIAVP